MAIGKRLSKRERAIAAITAIVIAFAGLYTFLLEPVALRWSEVRKRAQSAEKELAIIRHLIANRDIIERDYRQLQGAITTGSTEQQMKVDLLSEIDGMGRNCGLGMSYVKPTTVKEEGDFLRYGVEMQAVCQGHQFVKFLHQMQDPKHLLSADLVTLVVGRGDPPLTVTLRISKLARLES